MRLNEDTEYYVLWTDASGVDMQICSNEEYESLDNAFIVFKNSNIHEVKRYYARLMLPKYYEQYLENTPQWMDAGLRYFDYIYYDDIIIERAGKWSITKDFDVFLMLPNGGERWVEKESIQYDDYILQHMMGKPEWYDPLDFKYCYYRVREIAPKNKKGTGKNSKRLLPPSIRYDILKRDKYKCQICGRTQQHGVKLEIDHKVPVAKGGTNDADNLWTLCFDCNRGKSDKNL